MEFGLNNRKRFDEKSIIVTGGGSGIGRATALEFAAEGGSVVVADHNRVLGEETVALIRDSGADAAFVDVDVSQDESVKAMVAFAVARRGRLDVAFNNAGINVAGPRMADIEERDFDRIMAVNLKGVFLCMKHEINAMLRTGGGSIINTASVGGHIAAAGIGPYVASKHGVVGLTRTAAVEYASQGIRVNAVSPGATRTAMLEEWLKDPAVVAQVNQQQPIGRFAMPTEIARVVLFLASEDASFVVGHPLIVDGGMVCL